VEVGWNGQQQQGYGTGDPLGVYRFLLNFSISCASHQRGRVAFSQMQESESIAHICPVSLLLLSGQVSEKEDVMTRVVRLLRF